MELKSGWWLETPQLTPLPVPKGPENKIQPPRGLSEALGLPMGGCSQSVEKTWSLGCRHLSQEV